MSENKPQKSVDVGIGIVLRGMPDKKHTSGPGPAGTISILITRRKSDTVYPGYWEFPGGKSEPGEKIEDCVLRELLEEVGVTAEVFGVLSDVIHVYPHATVRLHPRLCRLAASSSAPRNLHVADHRWVQPEDLGAYTFPEANEAIVSELLGAISRGLSL